MVDLPFEVFVLFLGISLFIGLIGIIMGIRKIDGAPSIAVFAGILIFTQIVITSNLIFPNSPQTIQNFNIQELYHLHDWNAGISLDSSGFTISAIKPLVGSGLISDNFFDRLDCVQFPLAKSGSPTGIVEIATFDNLGRIQPVKFGEVDISTLTAFPLFTWKEFCLPATEHHFIAENDRIGIKYVGGNSTNQLRVAIDNTNPINDNLVVERFSAGTWTVLDSGNSDMAGVLYNRAVTEVNIPYTYEFNQNDTWAYMITLSALFIFIGIILQFRK